MDKIISFISSGFTQASALQVLMFTLFVTHITIIGVTVFLHRSQAHRALDLHPVIMHFFRFWLWMTTGMITKEWVAIHRKHHAKCEREGDPHSPMIYGIWKVFFQGAELYREEAANIDTLSRFGRGTPDDWIERNIYSKHSSLGILIMLFIDIFLFGVLGLSVWAVQMAWIPFWAAGVVNGMGHYFGYRNFASPDTSTNLFPIGFIISGEELHNNHHAFATSAKFSSKWYEFDLGWCYINIMRFFRLAKIKKIAPKLVLSNYDRNIDLSTLHGVIVHRYELMTQYADIIKDVVHQELKELKKYSCSDSRYERLKSINSYLYKHESIMQPKQLAEVDNVVSSSKSLFVLIQMRRDLGRIWEGSSLTSDQLVLHLKSWCDRAKNSEVCGLQKFASKLNRYSIV
ncbi:DesA family fatty acid desaturase [Candidatus Kinetoplastidibacterium crithidiae]|uniref:Stearoyl-CoA desaturase (Delta-9 desaturase) n=1 Tax=Candidatus Kinetoplastidibacterium crithidiae TCC036E TaxID=1208918 RepID=M1LWA7_9PROT|nr:fatty acid desaturase [Candidatus Kinetoplastibacterium crithidii]AFZ82823.1 fatty acid desaturase [Candidatus Kinetoplastibacterium crithidii (ex Angomonas deanei ATCC 30255)]AGF47524.1 stearoyl-CoA desaturase (delta-9 desaturase) [Candidatus Kinetoplastibacterium crithidii TCC036E]